MSAMVGIGWPGMGDWISHQWAWNKNPKRIVSGHQTWMAGWLRPCTLKLKRS